MSTSSALSPAIPLKVLSALRYAARRPAAQGIIFKSFITADLKGVRYPVSSDSLGFAAAFCAQFLLDLKANKW